MAENISCEECKDCIRCSLGLICGASRNKSKIIPSRPTIYGLIPYCDIPEWCSKAEKNKEAEDNERTKYGEINKAVLVLELPDNFSCGDCPCYNKEACSCNVTHEAIDGAFISLKCPLKKLPDKSHFNPPYVESQFHSGYLFGIYKVIKRLEMEAR